MWGSFRLVLIMGQLRVRYILYNLNDFIYSLNFCSYYKGSLHFINSQVPVLAPIWLYILLIIIMTIKTFHKLVTCKIGTCTSIMTGSYYN